MKKTQKKVLGYLGLGFVAAATAVAATMPVPGASATSSVTDTLVVRVVGSVPDVDLSGIANNADLTNPRQTVTLKYENVDGIVLCLDHTNLAGVTKTYQLNQYEQDYETGQLTFSLDLNDLGNYAVEADCSGNVPLVEEEAELQSASSDEDGYGGGMMLMSMDYSTLVGASDEDGYGAEPAAAPTAGGYGRYKIYVVGAGYGGVTDEDAIIFNYYPAIIETNDDGTLTVDTDEDNSDIHHIVVEFTGEDGKVAKTTTILASDIPESGDVPISTEGLKSGNYTVKVTAYDADDNIIYEAYSTAYVAVVVPSTGAPDTGGLFQNLNISREDYLVTGLIVFFVLGIVGFGLVAKNRNRGVSRSISRKRK